MTLWDLAKCKEARISHLCDQMSGPISNRLIEMGFETNQFVKCLRRTPLSGPVVIELGDSVYSLEQSIAEQVFIEGIEN